FVWRVAPAGLTSKPFGNTGVAMARRCGVPGGSPTFCTLLSWQVTSSLLETTAGEPATDCEVTTHVAPLVKLTVNVGVSGLAAAGKSTPRIPDVNRPAAANRFNALQLMGIPIRSFTKSRGPRLNRQASTHYSGGARRFSHRICC